jgi:uncharacterized protein YjiS (DUF1127 family)
MHGRKKEEEHNMSCASWTGANAAGAPTTSGGRGLPRLAGRIGSSIAKWWRAYWEWRTTRATVLVLRSLDRRTLHDIGVDPSEIESLAHDAGKDRRRHGYAARPWHGGGA